MRQKGNRHLHMRIKTTLRLDEKTAEAYKGRSLQVYMPLPVEYSQVENLKLLNFSHTPVSIADKHYHSGPFCLKAPLTGLKAGPQNMSWTTLLLITIFGRKMFQIYNRNFIHRKNYHISVLLHI